MTPEEITAINNLRIAQEALRSRCYDDASITNSMDFILKDQTGGKKWNSLLSYQVDDLVSYNGYIYICIVANNNKAPTNKTYWELSYGVEFSDGSIAFKKRAKIRINESTLSFLNNNGFSSATMSKFSPYTTYSALTDMVIVKVLFDEPYIDTNYSVFAYNSKDPADEPGTSSSVFFSNSYYLKDQAFIYKKYINGVDIVTYGTNNILDLTIIKEA